MAPLPPNGMQAPDEIGDDDLMREGRRELQDRLAVDQLPFLMIGTRVREGEKRLHVDRFGALAGNVHASLATLPQLLTSTGPLPCGRSPSLIMPRRLATSV